MPAVAPQHYERGAVNRLGQFVSWPGPLTVTSVVQGTGTALVVNYTMPFKLGGFNKVAVQWRLKGTMPFNLETSTASATGSFTIPGAVLQSGLRYQVQVAGLPYNGPWSPWSPLTALSEGTAGVAVTNTPPTDPGPPIIDGVGQTTVSAHWTPGTDTDLLQHEFQKAPGPAFNTWTAVSPPFVLSPLVAAIFSTYAPDTDYKLRDRAVDSIGQTSAWIESAIFHTLPLATDYPVPDINTKYVDPNVVSGGDGSQGNPWSMLSLATTNAAAIVNKKVAVLNGVVTIPADGITTDDSGWCVLASAGVTLFALSPGGVEWTVGVDANGVQGSSNRVGDALRATGDNFQMWGMHFRDMSLKAIKFTGDNALLQRCQFSRIQNWNNAKRAISTGISIDGPTRTIMAPAGTFTTAKGWRIGVACSIFNSPSNSKFNEYNITNILDDAHIVIGTNFDSGTTTGPATDLNAGGRAIEIRTRVGAFNNFSAVKPDGGNGSTDAGGCHNPTIRDCHFIDIHESDDGSKPDAGPGTIARGDPAVLATRQSWATATGNIFGVQSLLVESCSFRRCRNALYPKANTASYTQRNCVSICTYGAHESIFYGQVGWLNGPAKYYNNLHIDFALEDGGSAANGTQGQQATWHSNNTYARNNKLSPATSGLNYHKGLPPVPITSADPATEIISAPSHDFSNGDPVVAQNRPTTPPQPPPAGLTVGATYYVYVVDGDHVLLYDTQARALAGGLLVPTGKIDITATGTGQLALTTGLGRYRSWGNLFMAYDGSVVTGGNERFLDIVGNLKTYFETRPDGTPWKDYNHFEQMLENDSTATPGGSIKKLKYDDPDVESGVALTGGVGPQGPINGPKNWREHTGCDLHSTRGAAGVYGQSAAGLAELAASPPTLSKDDIRFYAIVAGQCQNSSTSDGTVTGAVTNKGCDTAPGGVSIGPTWQAAA